MKILNIYMLDADRYTIEEVFKLGQNDPGGSIERIAYLGDANHVFAITDKGEVITKVAVLEAMVHEFDPIISQAVIDQMIDDGYP